MIRISYNLSFNVIVNVTYPQKFSKLISLFLVSGSKFSRFAGNQEDAISRGFGQNFLPQCVRHSLARLLASLVFALLVLLLGGGITFAAAGERCCCFAADAEAAVGVGGRK